MGTIRKSLETPDGTLMGAIGSSKGTYYPFPAGTWQGVWDVGTTYSQGDVVSVPPNVYESLQDSNVGYDPSANPEWWQISPWCVQDSMVGGTAQMGGGVGSLLLPTGTKVPFADFTGPQIYLLSTIASSVIKNPWKFSAAFTINSVVNGDTNTRIVFSLFNFDDALNLVRVDGVVYADTLGLLDAYLNVVENTTGPSGTGIMSDPDIWFKIRVNGPLVEWYHGKGTTTTPPNEWKLFRSMSFADITDGWNSPHGLAFVLCNEDNLTGSDMTVNFGGLYVWDESLGG